MKHDLLFILKKLSHENTRELDGGAIRISQASIHFPKKVSIAFVKNFKNYDSISDYSDLRLPALSAEDRDRFMKQSSLYDAEVEESKQTNKKPKFYNGDNLILTGLEYDDENNIVYITADKVNYWFIRAIQNNVFPSDSTVYQYIRTTMGVHAPVITRDESTYLLERSNPNTQFFCPAAGFLEAKKSNPSLIDIVERTSEEELLEEILGDPYKSRVTSYSNGVRAINYVDADTPKWKPKVVDFIVPTHVNCDSKQMDSILENNLAKDAGEHTKKSFRIGLRDDNRPALFGLKKGGRGVTYHDHSQPGQLSTQYDGAHDASGDFAFGASIAACMIVNSGIPPHLPKHLPGTFARLFYLSKNNPQKSLGIADVESKESKSLSRSVLK